MLRLAIALILFCVAAIVTSAYFHVPRQEPRKTETTDLITTFRGD